MANTGYLGYSTLEEYFIDSPSTLTGREKANVGSDPNYVAPVQNTGSCPVTVSKTEIGISVLISLDTIEFFATSPIDTSISIFYTYYASDEFGPTQGQASGVINSGTAYSSYYSPGIQGADINSINPPESSTQYYTFI